MQIYQFSLNLSSFTEIPFIITSNYLASVIVKRVGWLYPAKKVCMKYGHWQKAIRSPHEFIVDKHNF